MNKKILYSLLLLALIFFAGSLIIYLRSGAEPQKDPGIIVEKNQDTEPEKRVFLPVKIFFLTEETRYMIPVSYEIEESSIRMELYRDYTNLLLSGNEKFIVPIPEGVLLRSIYYMLLVKSYW